MTTFYYNSSGQTRVDKRRGGVFREGEGGEGKRLLFSVEFSAILFLYLHYLYCCRAGSAGGGEWETFRTLVASLLLLSFFFIFWKLAA